MCGAGLSQWKGPQCPHTLVPLLCHWNHSCHFVSFPFFLCIDSDFCQQIKIISSPCCFWCSGASGSAPQSPHMLPLVLDKALIGLGMLSCFLAQQNAECPGPPFFAPDLESFISPSNLASLFGDWYVETSVRVRRVLVVLLDCNCFSVDRLGKIEL